MTERKPPGTSCETWIEAQIRVAAEEGAFDNLPGAGKPLPNLDQDFDLNVWVRQLVQREQLSISSMLPPSLELLARWRRNSPRSRSSTTKRASVSRVAALNAEIAKVNATVTRGAADAPRHRWTSIRCASLAGRAARSRSMASVQLALNAAGSICSVAVWSIRPNASIGIRFQPACRTPRGSGMVRPGPQVWPSKTLALKRGSIRESAR